MKQSTHFHLFPFSLLSVREASLLCSLRNSALALFCSHWGMIWGVIVQYTFLWRKLPVPEALVVGDLKLAQLLRQNVFDYLVAVNIVSGYGGTNPSHTV